MKWERNVEKGAPELVRPYTQETKKSRAELIHMAGLACIKAALMEKEGKLEEYEHYCDIAMQYLSELGSVKVERDKGYISYRECRADFDDLEILAMKYSGALGWIVRACNIARAQDLVEKAAIGDTVALKKLSDLTGYNSSLIKELAKLVSVNGNGKLQYTLPRRKDRVLPIDPVFILPGAVEYWEELVRWIRGDEDIGIVDPFISDIVWSLKTVPLWVEDEQGEQEVEQEVEFEKWDVAEGGEIYKDPAVWAKRRVRSRKRVQSTPVPRGFLPVAGIRWVPGGEELEECEA